MLKWPDPETLFAFFGIDCDKELLFTKRIPFLFLLKSYLSREKDHTLEIELDKNNFEGFSNHSLAIVRRCIEQAWNDVVNDKYDLFLENSSGCSSSCASCGSGCSD